MEAVKAELRSYRTLLSKYKANITADHASSIAELREQVNQMSAEQKATNPNGRRAQGQDAVTVTQEP